MKLEAILREQSGTSASRRDRSEGYIPANLYGKDIDNKSIKIKKTDIDAVIRKLGTNAIVEIQLEGEEPERAIIKDAQRDIIQYELVHVDFQKIEKGQKLRLTVPVNIIGDDYEIEGGIIEQHMDEIEIESIPMNIPKEIDVDVSNLDVGDSITVADLETDGYEFLSSPEETIVAVSAHQFEEEIDEDEEITEPELIGEEKEEDEEEGSEE
ncbi:MAG: 50S ribosomal protein L25 [Andreesenia angusta]|nr:50S ribosomal protein L25 [Andreesenia angusta]